MGKLLYLENANTSSRLWYAWFDGEYQAIDVSGKSRIEAIALLPNPTPNFVQQVGRNRDEVIQLVKEMQAEALLGSPL
jgi:hypothetical protein